MQQARSSNTLVSASEMEWIKLPLAGCWLLRSGQKEDERGYFQKLFHQPTFAARGLETSFAESYLSSSHRGVVRGMHFQLPPADHAKLVSCIAGRVRDGLVDLRRDSPTYLQSYSLILSETEAELVYIPRGVAHGFAALENHSVMWYLVGSAYEPQADSGVHSDSVGIDWWQGEEPPEAVIVSQRDRSFTPLAQFNSPFVFEG